MAGNIKEGREIRYGFANQTTFVTPIADSEDFIQISCNHFDIDPDIRIDEDESAQGTINPTVDETIHISSGGMANFTIQAPFNNYLADYFAYAHFQKVAESGSSPWGTTFTYFTSHPDFDSDEGKFLTWCKRFPTASTSHKIGGCIAKSFKVSGARDEKLMYEGDWVGLGAGVTDANMSGAWGDNWSVDTSPSPVEDNDADGIQYFNSMTSAVVTIDSSPFTVKLRSFEVEGRYEVEKVGQETDQGYDTFGIYDRSGTFSLAILKDASVDNFLAAHTAGTLISTVLSWPDLIVTFTGKIEERPQFDADGLLGLTITGKLLAANSSADMFEVVIENYCDRGWPE